MTSLIAYVQQRRLARVPVERLGLASSLRWFGRIVSEHQDYRLADPAGLIDYLLDDTGDIGRPLLRTHGVRSRPPRYVPHN